MSVTPVDVADGSAAVVLAAGEVGVAGVVVGEGEGVGLWVGGAVVGCGVGSEAVLCPEQAARASAAKEEMVRTVRRLTDCFSKFIRA